MLTLCNFSDRLCVVFYVIWLVPSTNGVNSVPSGRWLVCAQFAAAGFIPTIRFRRKISAILFCSVTKWTPDFWASGMIFLSFLLFLLSAFLTGAPLDTNHIYCCFDTFRWTKIYFGRLFCDYDPFGRKWYPRGWALRKPLDPSCLSLHSLFSIYIAFCVLFQQLFTFAPYWYFDLDGF